MSVQAQGSYVQEPGWAQQSSRGSDSGAIRNAVPILQRYWTELLTLGRPRNVAGYALGDVTRICAQQDAEVAAGRSSLGCGQSSHSIYPAEGIDVFALSANGDVIGDPRAYAQIAQVALRFGLRTGASWGDHGHVQTPDWQDKVEAVRRAHGDPRAAQPCEPSAFMTCEPVQPGEAAGIGLAILIGLLLWAGTR